MEQPGPPERVVETQPERDILYAEEETAESCKYFNFHKKASEWKENPSDHDVSIGRHRPAKPSVNQK